MSSSISLGHILGIKVDIHLSMFLLVGFLSWSLATGLLPTRYPDWEAVTYWATGVASALSLFASVLLHEFAHSLVARRRRYHVEGITLFILGGVSNLESEADKPGDEFAIAVVGPLTSLGIGAVIYLFLRSIDGSSPAFAVFEYVALINLVLAAFNMLPAFPLDGGRVFRSAIWAVTGSFNRATSIATRGGQIVGFLLMVCGAVLIFQGFVLQGVWTSLIGWFLNSTATTNQRETEFERLLAGARVQDVMETSPPTIEPTVTIHDAVLNHLVNRGTRALTVCEGERVLGIVSFTDVKDVPQELWTIQLVQEVMTKTPLKNLQPDDELYDALSLLGENRIHQAPVMIGDRLVGLLNRAHVIQYLHQIGELSIK